MAAINGTSGDDTLNGTVDSDTINGLDGQDSINGLDGDDTLNGGAGNDSLFGGNGNDTLDGGPGQDTMWGGPGDDTYIVDQPNEVTYEAAGEGSDNILASISYYLPANVEKLTLTGTAAIDGTGNDANNILVGNSAANVLSGMGGIDNLSGSGGDDTLIGGDGADNLNGGSGNDVIQGGAGNDQLTGGTGDDTFKFQIGDGSDTIVDLTTGDLIQINGYVSAQSVSQSGTDVIMTLSATETLTLSNTTVAIVQAASHFDGSVVLTGSSGSDTLDGTDYADTIDGNYGDDTINGFGGNDTLNGDDGSDVIYGGDGDDAIDGGAGQDYLFGDAGNDLIHGGSSIDRIVDGAGNDTVYGDADQDTFIGSAGDDYYDGGSTVTSGSDFDTVDYAGASAGIVVDMRLSSGQVHSASSGDAANIGIDTLVDIERVSGSNFNDVMTASDSSIQFFGGDGDDSLTGGAGSDVLNGGSGNDFLDGGAGVDTAQYTGAVSGVRVSLAVHGPQDTAAAGADTLVNIENLVGTQFSDVLTGDDSNNRIDGHSGAADTIYGGGGNDELYGGNGSYLVGGDGNDTIYTNFGTSETIEFHAGDDQDEVNGIAYNDVVEIHDYQAAQSITQVGNDVVVKFSDTDQITFKSADLKSVEAALHFVDVPRPPESLNAPISSIRPADVVLSPDGTTLYVADTDGAVRAYDLATRALEATWQVGQDLGGIDVSPDGTYLLVAERQPVSYNAATPTTDASTTITTYKITVATGDVVSLPMDVPGNVSSGFYDVEIMNDGHARVSQEMYNYPVRELDVSTSQYSLIGQTFGGDGVLIGSNDHATVAFTSQNQIPSEVAIFSATDRLAYWAGFSTPYTSPATGVFAYSAEAGLVVQQQYDVSIYDTLFSALLVFNAALNQFFDLADLHPEWGDGRISGLAFDATGANLFVLDDDTDTIVQVSTSDWHTVRSFNVGADIGDFAEGDFGNRLLVTADGRYFVVVTANGVQLVENDTLANDFVGTAGDDRLASGIGDDHLSGLQGSDHLEGGVGNDTLSGGAGNDIIDGGAGADTATYIDAPSGVTVSLSKTGAQNTIADGTDTLSGIENLEGSNYSDNLTGDAGTNSIHGGYGDDRLDGGAGADKLYGGDGNDTYVVDNVSDIISELVAQGTDLVQASVTYSLRSNIENLTLTGSAAIDGAGNGLDNELRGNAAANTLDGGSGQDTILGNAGDDTLIGGAGNDVLNGGAGNDDMTGGLNNDTYYVDSAGDIVTENAGEGIDTVVSTIDYTLGVNVENLTFLGTAVNATGNALDNVIRGSNVANLIDGGAGADQMIGNAGNDTYVVDNAGDRVLETTNFGNDTVLASVTFKLGANVENLTLTGSANLAGTGNGLDNVITGNEGGNTIHGQTGDDTLIGNGGNDILIGNAGADSMTGGAGNDTYYVDDAGDTVTENAGEGADTVKAGINWTLETYVENISLTGPSSINGTGNELANSMHGNSGDNILDGAAGADSIVAGSGNDTLIGGADRDTMIGGAGDDTFLFHDGDFGGATRATADRITDFTSGEDKIDLSAVDANTLMGGDQSFAFVGTNAFTHTAGELRYEQISGSTYIEGDTNGDGIADFMIKLDGLHALTGTDFLP